MGWKWQKIMVTEVGFEPTPPLGRLRPERLRPLGHFADEWAWGQVPLYTYAYTDNHCTIEIRMVRCRAGQASPIIVSFGKICYLVLLVASSIALTQAVMGGGVFGVERGVCWGDRETQ